MIKPLVLFITLLLLYSCNESKPRDVLTPQKMQQILWDVVRANVLSEELARADSTKNQVVENSRLLEQVFIIHKISREQFDKSYGFYTSHPDLFKPILDSIEARQNILSSTPAIEKPVVSDTLKKDSLALDSVIRDSVKKDSLKKR